MIHEQRAEDDGYRSPLATGLRASADAERLAQEIGFAEGRLLALRTAPPDLYGEIREQEDPEQAMWMCFLSAYLSPLEGPDPFAGIRKALQADWRAGELPDLNEIPLGPRTSHDPARGDATLRAYLQWAEHAGSQALGIHGRPRLEPGEALRADLRTAHAAGPGADGPLRAAGYRWAASGWRSCAPRRCASPTPASAHDDLATLAAKRVFGIGDQMHLEHRRTSWRKR